METIKKIMPLITLIIGLGAGYLLFKKDCEKEFIDKEAAFKVAFIKENKATFKSTKQIITDPDSIRRMREEYRNESRGLMFGSDGHKFLQGYHIKRADLEKILSDQSYDAIGFYLGKHPDYLGKPDRVYTLMFMGAKKNSATSYTDNYSTGVYDHVDICPDVCGTF